MAEPEGPRYDSTALDKIIKRATELHAAERDMTGSMTGEEVLALGREVGLPERYLKQAMLESSMTPQSATEPESWTDELIGVSEVATNRVIRGDARAIEEALVRYMDEEEAFKVIRQSSGHVWWEKLGGWAGAVRKVSSRTFMLQNADRVVATITGLESGFVHVDLRAGLRSNRNAYAGGGAAVVSTGIAGTAILATLGAIWPLVVLPAPVAIAIGWFVLRQFKHEVERTQLGLECALDALERGTRQGLATGERPGLVDTLIREIAKPRRP